MEMTFITELRERMDDFWWHSLMQNWCAITISYFMKHKT